MVLLANAVVRESVFNFYTQFLIKWMLLVEAVGAGVTGSAGTVHRDLDNYMYSSLRYSNFFPV